RPLLEALRLERAREGLLEDENDAVSALAQHLADADAVIRRAVRALREEDDRRHRRGLSHNACDASRDPRARRREACRAPALDAPAAERPSPSIRTRRCRGST